MQYNSKHHYLPNATAAGLENDITRCKEASLSAEILNSQAL